MTHHCPHCGGVFEDSKAKKDHRSTPQHRRFFALCRAARASWPEGHWFKPKSDEHMRFFLECMAGHYTTTVTARIESADPDKVYNLVRAFLRHTDDQRVFIELDGNLLIEKRTKSISYETLGNKEFTALAQAIEEIIETEIGIAPEKLLRETERAA